MTAKRMINIRMPEELVIELDRFVAEGERSAFIIKAIEAELRKERIRASIRAMAGSVSAEDAPYWATPEAIVAWVRAQRAVDADNGLPKQ